MVKNYMETLVSNALSRELKEHPEKYEGLCRCPACMATVMATALNSLKPFYVTCVAGEVFGEYRNKEQQYQSDVLVAVGKGIASVIAQGPHQMAGSQ